MRNILLLIIALALGQTAWAQPKPKTYSEEVAEVRRGIEAELSRLPSLGTMPMSEVLQLKLDGKDLTIQSQIKPSTTQSKVQVPGMNGPAIVMVRSIGAAGWAAMQFIHKDLQRTDAVLVVTSVMSGPGYLQVSQDAEREDRMTSVQLIQNLRVRQAAPDEAEAAVRLFVQRSNQETGEKLVDVTLFAPSFVELLRQHPKEVAEYLRPIFHDLKQEATVFSMEDDVAWQVLGPVAKLDPAVGRQVQALVQQLGAEKVADRQAAAEALKKLPRPALLSLIKADRAKLSPEQNAQLDLLLEPYRTLSKAEAEAMLDDVEFLLNTLASEDVTLRTLAFQRLDEKLGRKLTFDLDAPQAERLKAIGQLRAQVTTHPAE